LRSFAFGPYAQTQSAWQEIDARLWKKGERQKTGRMSKKMTQRKEKKEKMKYPRERGKN
jgi:hypothetical protein